LDRGDVLSFYQKSCGEGRKKKRKKKRKTSFSASAFSLFRRPRTKNKKGESGGDRRERERKRGGERGASTDRLLSWYPPFKCFLVIDVLYREKKRETWKRGRKRRKEEREKGTAFPSSNLHSRIYIVDHAEKGREKKTKVRSKFKEGKKEGKKAKSANFRWSSTSIPMKGKNGKKIQANERKRKGGEKGRHSSAPLKIVSLSRRELGGGKVRMIAPG